ncbi:MAG: hypothetical protein IJ910_04915 [Bacteroidaceae bacterium]|nr:hypothetical protein [Bacteroidaceae bacterium]
MKEKKMKKVEKKLQNYAVSLLLTPYNCRKQDISKTTLLSLPTASTAPLDWQKRTKKIKRFVNFKKNLIKI